MRVKVALQTSEIKWTLAFARTAGRSTYGEFSQWCSIDRKLVL